MISRFFRTYWSSTLLDCEGTVVAGRDFMAMKRLRSLPYDMLCNTCALSRPCDLLVGGWDVAKC